MPRIDANRICIIRSSAIGDVVHALAMVNGIRKGYPNAHLTWILQDIPSELITHHPSLNRIISFNKKMSLMSWIKFIKLIKKDHYDLLIVPQTSVRASLITKLINADIKLGFDITRARELNWLVTNQRIPGRNARHVLDQFLEFLDYLEINDYEPEWNIYFTEEELRWKEKWAAAFSKPLAGLVPASSDSRKDWLPERYATLADRLVSELDMQPVIICGPGKKEIRLARDIHSRAICKPRIASEKPIRRTMLQLSACQLVIAPDTGPLHLAVAIGIPSIGLYGFSNPSRCGPYKYRDLIVDKFNEPGESSPPFRQTKNNKMVLITVDDVIDKIYLAKKKYIS